MQLSLPSGSWYRVTWLELSLLSQPRFLISKWNYHSFLSHGTGYPDWSYPSLLSHGTRYPDWSHRIRIHGTRYPDWSYPSHFSHGTRYHEWTFVISLVPSAEYRHGHYLHTQSIILFSVCHTPSVVDTAHFKRPRIYLLFHFLLYF